MKGKGQGVMALAVVLWWAAAPAQPLYAEIQQMELAVDGLSCPFCSLGLEKKLTRVEGVAAVTIHMKQGLTDVQPKPDQPLNLADIRRAVKEAGFTLRDIRLTVNGAVAHEDGAWVLESSGDGTRFLLFDAEHAQTERSSGAAPISVGNEFLRTLEDAAQRGTHVVVTGRVHEHAGLPAGLLIERIELQQP
ncbi:MAG: heavy-metal-associated domain-containing protein [Candidatus Omnitrophica bacterium]|nr:heavy-metal-associated domain-containing protein [Candidatus Omnitrophota bacterium]